MSNDIVSTIITTGGLIIVGLIARQGAVRAKIATTQNHTLLREFGVMKIEMNGHVQELLEVTQALALAQGIVLGRAQEKEDEKKRSQSIQIPK